MTSKYWLPEGRLASVGRLIARDNAALDLVIDGRYEVRKLIGKGGMGQVFLVRDARLDRDVAMKILTQDVSDDGCTERLREEARTQTQLDHEGIVPIHDCGRLPDGRAYCVMKLVQGRTLWSMMGSKSSRQRLLDVVEQACLIADFAHEKGVLHRDLKPANIMVDGRRRVFVVDWGVAAALEEGRGGSARRAGDGAETVVVGTLPYMSPEQARGDVDALDRRCDVYSLGTILYECLSGRPVLDLGQDTFQVLARSAEPDFPPPRAVDASVPADLDAICMKALAASPSGRYATARDLADDLRRFRERRPVQARPRALPGRLALWSRRHPLTASLAAAALLAVSGTVLALRSSSRSSSRLGDAEVHASAREEALRLLERARPGLEDAARDLDHGTSTRAQILERMAEPRRLIEQAIRLDSRLALGPYLASVAWEIEGEYDRAERELRRAVGLDPALGAAHYRLGRLLVLRAFLATTVASQRAQPGPKAETLASEAERELERAIATGSGFNDRLQRQVAAGMRAYTQADAKSFASIVREGLAEFRGKPGEEELHWLAGIGAPQGPQRIACFDRALTLRPRYFPALFGRAVERTLAGDDAAAEADYDAALAVNPRHAETWLNRGVVRARRQAHAKGLEDLEMAISLKPDWAIPYVNRGLIRFQLGDVDAALRDFDEAIRRDDRVVEAWLNRGVALDSVFRHLEAVASCDRALALDAKSVGALTCRAGAKKSLGDAAAARGDLDEALSIDERYLPARITRGFYRLQAGELDRAEEDFGRILELNASQKEAWAGRGDVLLAKTSYEAAEAAFSRAVEIDPDYAMALTHRAEARRALGRIDECVADLERAMASPQTDAATDRQIRDFIEKLKRESPSTPRR